MSKSRTTIKDIARELNISTSTVSRALTDRWDVNPETRKAVLELAEKLNYRPNPISLNLKQQQSMTIAVVVPEFITSFFSEVLTGIQSVMEEEGYNILISQSHESAETELRNLKMMESKMVDGFIVSVSHGDSNKEFYKHLTDKNIPLVFVNRVCPGIPAPKVVIDDYKWSYKAVEHLIRNGYKRIMHLTGPEDIALAKERRRGYENALRDNGLPIDPELIVHGGLMMEVGVLAAHRILEMENRPDAIFAFHDPLAIGVMKTLLKNGVRIPEDIAVVGFSESLSALIIEPNLTSVEQPTYEMGRAAAELLLEQIRNMSEESILRKSIILEAKLNVRESSARKPEEEL